MKARGIIMIDYDLKGGFVDAADEQRKLTQLIQDYVDGNRRVVSFQIDIRERRGDKAPDIRRLKLRTS